MVSINLGKAWVGSSDLAILQSSTRSDATFEGVTWDDESFVGPLYYGVRVEHWFGGGAWGGLADFTHYKIFADTEATVDERGVWLGVPVEGPVRLGERVQGFSASHGTNYAGLGVLWRWLPPARRAGEAPRWYPYLGGGPIAYILHVEADINGAGISGYQYGGLGLLALAGVQVRVARPVAMYLEGKYDRGTPQVDVGGGGSASLSLSTYHLVLGAGYRF